MRPRAYGDRSRHRIGGAQAAVVVASHQVVPALDDEAGFGEAVAYGLGGGDYGGGHTAGRVHLELDVGEFGHIQLEPVGA